MFAGNVSSGLFKLEASVTSGVLVSRSIGGGEGLSGASFSTSSGGGDRGGVEAIFAVAYGRYREVTSHLKQSVNKAGVCFLSQV